LTEQKLINVAHEELKLSLLCIQYLSLDCFKDNLTDHQIQTYIKDGHYSFLPYAAVHWLDHLEACCRLFVEYAETDIGHLVCILGRFVDQNWRGGAGTGSTATNSRFRAFKRFPAIGRIRILASSKDSGLGREGSLKLGPFILRMRRIFEEVAVTENGKSSLLSFYGDRLFKCELPYCVHFHEGFSSAQSRDQHSDKHQRQSKCPHAGCNMAVVGFASDQQLKAHLARIHPKPIDDDVEFPSVITFQATSIAERVTAGNITGPVSSDSVKGHPRYVPISVRLPLSELRQ
jgi:hypothetical protein